MRGTASRLELFFDLAYVLVVLELAKRFYEDLTWHGAAVMAGLFVTMWVSWVGFTLYANRFDTDDVIFRIAKLVATGSIAGCAAKRLDAAGKLVVPFAACYLGSLLVLLALYGRDGTSRRPGPPSACTCSPWVWSAALWAVSLVVPSPARYLLWAIAALVSAAGPVLATLRSDKYPLQIEHLPERFALLVIFVLGEAGQRCPRRARRVLGADFHRSRRAWVRGRGRHVVDLLRHHRAEQCPRAAGCRGRGGREVEPGRRGHRQPRQRRQARPIRLWSPAADLRHRTCRGWSGGADRAPGRGCPRSLAACSPQGSPSFWPRSPW